MGSDFVLMLQAKAVWSNHLCEQLDWTPAWQRLSALPYFVIKRLKGKLQISLIIIYYSILCWRGNRSLWLQLQSFKFTLSGWRTGKTVFFEVLFEQY